METLATEIDETKRQLACALASIKIKDEALNAMLERFGIMSDGCIKQASIALAIQPDDAALKAWLGKAVGHVTFPHHRKAPDVDWAVGRLIEKGMALYSPKELK